MDTPAEVSLVVDAIPNGRVLAPCRHLTQDKARDPRVKSGDPHVSRAPSHSSGVCIHSVQRERVSE